MNTGHGHYILRLKSFAICIKVLTIRNMCHRGWMSSVSDDAWMQQNFSLTHAKSVTSQKPLQQRLEERDHRSDVTRCLPAPGELARVCVWGCRFVAAMLCLRALRLSNSAQLIVKGADAAKKVFIIQPACCLATNSTSAFQRRATHSDPLHLKT